jgi:hypothetical protein
VKIFSYVVDHDFGNEPNPRGGICTLCRCKFGEKLEKTRGTKGQKNIVELAEKGDWVIGTGGKNLKTSAGHGRLIYAMRIDETPKGSQCVADKRFRKRMPADPLTGFQEGKQFALVSKRFYYFGSEPFDNRPVDISGFKLEKNPRGFHYIDSTEFNRFRKWLEAKYEPGIHGKPRTQTTGKSKGSKICKSSC